MEDLTLRMPLSAVSTLPIDSDSSVVETESESSSASGSSPSSGSGSSFSTSCVNKLNWLYFKGNTINNFQMQLFTKIRLLTFKYLKLCKSKKWIKKFSYHHIQLFFVLQMNTLWILYCYKTSIFAKILAGYTQKVNGEGDSDGTNIGSLF